jgi:hypothetical protein
MRAILFAAGLMLVLCDSGFGQANFAPAGPAVQDRELFNVRDYGAKGDASADDSVAIASAATAAAGSASSGRTAVLYFPAGVYRLVTALQTWTAALSVAGDGHAQSVILVDPNFSGDVFSWSDVRAGEDDDSAHAARRRSGGDGVEVRGIRIVGNRTTANKQNAFVFYDRADHVVMQDVDVFYMTGRALLSGAPQRTSTAYIRQSRFDSLRFFNCGSAGVPVVDFNSHGNAGATRQVSIDSLDIYAPYGTGVVVHGDGATVRDVRFSKLRIEGLQNGAISADLLQVGDAALGGSVADIAFDQAELIDAYTGFAAIRFAGANLSVAPHDVHYQGMIGGGLPNGKGIVIDAGRSLLFDLRGIHTFDVSVVVASSATVGGPVVLDGHGQESGWTRSIDPSSVASVRKPALQRF